MDWMRAPGNEARGVPERLIEQRAGHCPCCQAPAGGVHAMECIGGPPSIPDLAKRQARERERMAAALQYVRRDLTSMELAMFSFWGFVERALASKPAHDVTSSASES